MKKYIDQFQSFEKGKKVKIVIMAALVVVILYMALGMLGGSGDNYTPVNNNTMAKPEPVKTITKKLEASVVAKPKIEKPQVVVNTLSKKQKAYINSISQLQMLQLLILRFP